MRFSLPDSVQNMCFLLHEHDFQAFVVGGCVRDLLLGLTPHDYDITTNATPQQIIQLFGKENCSEYGRAFGTVGVKYSGGFAEITTFRTETDYTDYRHPGKVLFAQNLPDDLSRRDFTCNAIAYDPLAQKLVDLFNGQADIQNKILRCVGVPSARFREDALRILRGMRFCARFGFKPDLLTDSAMKASAFQLKFISAERIFSELCSMLMGDDITEILIAYPQILAVRIPEILPCIAFTQHTHFHDFTVWEHTARAVGNSPKNLIVRLTMLFHDIAKPSCFTWDENGGHFKTHADKSAKLADKILLRLKSDNHTRKLVCKLIAHHREIPRSLPAVRRILKDLSYEEFELYLQVLEADRISKLNGQPESRFRIDKAENFFQICKEQNLCCRIKDLAVSGNDLIALGFQGKQIGMVLNHLLESVISGTPNQKDKLLSLAEEFLI